MRHPLFTIALWLIAACACAQTPEWPALRTLPVATGLQQPVDIQSPRDGSGRLFIVEQRGRIRILRDGALLPQPFLDIISRVTSGGEMGLLGLAFPPGFAAKQYFYVNYTTGGSPPNLRTVIARFRVSPANPDVADPNSEEAILTYNQPFTNHNGGGLVFGPDGYLYIGTGDGGSGGDPQNNAQSTDRLLGKMLRIDVESGTAPYRVPDSNPFVGRTGYRPEIWATGLRNPWRYSFDRLTGDLFIADVGQNRLEEVNHQPAASRGGENYGWNRMEGTQCFQAGCSTAGLVLPVAEYGRTLGCSVTGGHVYRGGFFPRLGGIYFYGDYCTGNIWGLRRSGGAWQNQVLLDSSFSISAFGEDEVGEVYLADLSRGEVQRLATAGPGFSAASTTNAASFASGIAAGGLVTIFGAGLVQVQGVLLQATSFPLPQSLGGVSVTINGVPAPLLAVARSGAREQINLQVPWEVAGSGTVNIVVTSGGAASDAVAMELRPVHPGIFVLGDGSPAVVHGADYTVVTASRPALPGEVLSLFATGLGAVSNRPPTGSPAAGQLLSMVSAPVQVTLNAQPAEVLFAGLAPNFAGLYQVNFRVPASLPAGTYTLVLTAAGAASNSVAVPVR